MTEPTHAPAEVGEDALTDLHDRLRRRRSSEVVFGETPAPGVNGDWLASLARRWEDGYDWRVHEARIRSLPWELVDGASPLRVVHRKAGAEAPVVLLLHGWPDSVLRFERVLPLLTRCTVVAPALPGFPFSVDAPGRGMSVVEMADVIAEAMQTLGYERYIVSAGDVGCGVAEALMRAHTDAVQAAHLTDISEVHLEARLPDDLTAAERDYVRRWRAWTATEAAYGAQQATKPATLAAALTDSPVGLLAWIGEKLHSWTDHGGDISTVLAPDDILTWVSAYWFTGAIGSSFGPYASRMPPSNDRVPGDIPVVMSVFPGDLLNAPRDFVERLFSVHSFREHARGGHFAAWEQPEQYVADLEVALAARRL